MMRYIVFLTLCAAVLLSCSNPGESADEYTGIFPLSVGVQWTYEQTVFTDSLTEVSTYTLEVDSSVDIGGYNWQRIRIYSPLDEIIMAPFPNFYYLMEENGKIYELQWNFSVPVRSLQYFIPKNRVEEFETLFGGDVFIIKTVRRLSSPIQTPAGTFYHCYEFLHEWPSNFFSEIFVPGVGIVKKEYIYRHFRTGDTIIHVIDQLSDFRIPETDID